MDRNSLTGRSGREQQLGQVQISDNVQTTFPESVTLLRLLRKVLPTSTVSYLKRRFQRSYSERLLSRYREYLRTGVSKPSDQALLRAAAFESNSHVLDAAHALAVAAHPHAATEMAHPKGVLRLSEGDFSEARENLRREGYWVAPNRIPDDLLDGFLQSAKARLETLSGTQVTSEQLTAASSQGLFEEMVFLGSSWALSQELAISLATSPEVLRVAADYLGVAPVLSLPESWFSFPVARVREGSAQQWHWDCDRIRWVKMFVYINDVGDENGPHAFLSGSHRGWEVRTASSRATREQLFSACAASRERVFTAPRGTVIFEDTRGFHRGTPLSAGYRLVLQLEFAIDDFGYSHPTFTVPEMYRSAFARYPRLGQNVSFT